MFFVSFVVENPAMQTALEKELKERLDVHEAAIVSILQRVANPARTAQEGNLPRFAGSVSGLPVVAAEAKSGEGRQSPVCRAEENVAKIGRLLTGTHRRTNRADEKESYRTEQINQN